MCEGIRCIKTQLFAIRKVCECIVYVSEWASYICIIYVQQNATELYFTITDCDAFYLTRLEHIVIAHSKCIFKDTQTGFIYIYICCSWQRIGQLKFKFLFSIGLVVCMYMHTYVCLYIL